MYLNAFNAGHSYHFHGSQIWIIVMTHRRKFGNKKIVSSMIRRRVFFDVRKSYKL